jgi:hypothetical protein
MHKKSWKSHGIGNCEFLKKCRFSGFFWNWGKPKSEKRWKIMKKSLKIHGKVME